MSHQQINVSTNQRINPPSAGTRINPTTARVRRAGKSTLARVKCKIKRKFKKGYWIYFPSTHKRINKSTHQPS